MINLRTWYKSKKNSNKASVLIIAFYWILLLQHAFIALFCNRQDSLMLRASRPADR